MRVFWIIIALLTLLAAFVLPFTSSDDERDVARASALNNPPSFDRPVNAADNDVDQAFDEGASDNDTPPVIPSTGDDAAVDASDVDVEDDDDAVDPTIAIDEPDSPNPDLVDTTTTGDGTDGVAEADRVDGNAPDTLPDLGTGDDPEALEPGSKANIVTREDGSILIDDIYEITGSGTKEDPYTVPWDLLLSAADEYQPRKGQKAMPERVQMFPDKWVSLDGYFIFPMFATSFDEALVMLNQWDGCCIGVPPSVYDSIEVRLDQSVTMNRGHFAPFGSFIGKLKVDPYVVNNWLIGLYLMEEAQVKTDL